MEEPKKNNKKRGRKRSTEIKKLLKKWSKKFRFRCGVQVPQTHISVSWWFRKRRGNKLREKYQDEEDKTHLQILFSTSGGKKSSSKQVLSQRSFITDFFSFSRLKNHSYTFLHVHWLITYNIFFIVWTLGRKKTHTYKLTLHKHGNNTETGPQRTPTPTANTTLNDWRVSAVLSGGARRGKWNRARVLRDGMGSFSFFRRGITSPSFSELVTQN